LSSPTELIEKTSPQPQGELIKDKEGSQNDIPVTLILGQPLETPMPFRTVVNGQEKMGSFLVKIAYIDLDEVDGTDVTEFTWQTESDKNHKTYHGPGYFLRLMFAEKRGLSGHFTSEMNGSEKNAFSSYLLVKEAKSLIDDRTYETIQISDDDYQIQLKYLGLHVSLAAIQDDAEHILVLISGVQFENDILNPFVVKVPLNLLIESSSTKFEIEENAWIEI
jgi:hypothetical protein